MTSLLWTLGVYLGTTWVAWRLRLVAPRTPDDRRVLCALLLVLAGAHSTAVRTGAEDVIANPVVLETALRGCLDLLALFILAPLAAKTPWSRSLGSSIGAISLMVYLALAGISTLYSAAPIVTAGKAFELGVGLVLVFTATGLEPDHTSDRLLALIRATVVFEAGLLIVALAGFFLMPQTFSQFENRPGFLLPQTLASPYSHSNGLSSSGALVSVYAVAELLTGAAGRLRRVWALLGCLGALGVVLASGRQGIAMWVASMAVLMWYWRRRWFVILLAPTAVGLGVAYREVLTAALSRGQPNVTLATWSGRFDFWSAGLEVWRQHPWLGYGFGAGGRFVALKSVGYDEVSSLHSGYMEALTGVGLLGVLPLGVAIALVVVWAIRSLRATQEIPVAILIVPLLLRTLVSDGFGAWLNTEFLIFAALVVAADEQRRRTRMRRRLRARADRA